MFFFLMENISYSDELVPNNKPFKVYLLNSQRIFTDLEIQSH